MTSINSQPSAEQVAGRLRITTPVIAPHEWRSGDKPWLIDVVAPFGDAEAVATEAAAQFAAGKAVSGWLPTPSGQPTLRELGPRG